ncbi:MAG: hypothetical protein ACRD21_12070 [Vicinamibacteria bacterium]
MIEKFRTYVETLEGLSTEELDRSVEKLVRAEKRNVALVIAHIAEMSRRKGALERGFRNLFDYCVRRLNLSEGSVALRLQVANVSRRFPQLLVALAENRVSLTVAGLLAPHLTEENVEKLLAECAGMTKREVEEHLVALRPRPVFTPSIRKTPSPGLEIQRFPPSPVVSQTASVPAAPPVPETPNPRLFPRPSPSILQPATPTQYNFRFAAGREFKDKFERLAEVLGVENPLAHMAEILERAVDIALDQKDLKRKLERRKGRQSRRKGEVSKSRPDEILPTTEHAASRYLPSEVQERVHARAGHQCEFRGPDGTRCRARTGLEIEHEKPFALHRSHEERFLRLYCRGHNRLSAERVYGVEFIQGKIAASRQRRSASSHAETG